MLPVRNNAAVRVASFALRVFALGIAAGVSCGAIAFDRISADSLRANVTWLAADQREGRLTPSPGLEASADYMAARFRDAGLAPGGSNGTFFQTAAFTQITPQLREFTMRVQAGSRRASIGGRSVVIHSLAAIDFDNEPVLRLPDRPQVSSLPDIAGHVVLGNDAWDTQGELFALEARKPSLILLVIDGQGEPEEVPFLMDADPTIPPVIRIYGHVAVLPGGRDPLLTLHAAAPIRHDVMLRNVAGMLQGSDPAVRDQVVILSAHYDHLGTKSPGPGNRIFHGANDNASGDASLIEIAKALAGDSHPRRSVLFLALLARKKACWVRSTTCGIP